MKTTYLQLPLNFLALINFAHKVQLSRVLSLITVLDSTLYYLLKKTHRRDKGLSNAIIKIHKPDNFKRLLPFIDQKRA